jgi:hypothetical protein
MLSEAISVNSITVVGVAPPPPNVEPVTVTSELPVMVSVSTVGHL